MAWARGHKRRGLTLRSEPAIRVEPTSRADTDLRIESVTVR